MKFRIVKRKKYYDIYCLKRNDPVIWYEIQFKIPLLPIWILEKTYGEYENACEALNQKRLKKEEKVNEEKEVQKANKKLKPLILRVLDI